MGTTAPRPRDAERTAQAILESALRLFSERGYPNVGVRDVADDAGVNTALVARYFGSKLGLFEACLDQVLDLSALLDRGHEDAGTALVEALIVGTEKGSPFQLLILSASAPDAGELILQVLERRAMQPLVRWLGPPKAKQRALRIAILWSGYLVSSKLIPFHPRDAKTLRATHRWLARQTQAVIDDDDP